MSLIINHNLMAMNAARNLSQSYSLLAKSTQRLSSGLRVNSAADDAAGLAIRELMRADIAVINQGVRNAGDAISMIQTAEGAMSVIDEKLIRMKELAEQAATGTYTTGQRSIMDSEYQAMAAEIDRIANATDFNGVKLLDGSLVSQHSGSGMKIHFGSGNSAAEDYYYVKIGDMRATAGTGLQVGNSDTNDIFRTASINSLTPTSAVAGTDGLFGVQYTTNNGTTWNTYGYVNVNAGTDTLTDLVTQINAGSAQSGSFSYTPGSVVAGDSITIGANTFNFVNGGGTATTFNSSTHTGTVDLTGANAGTTFASKLAALINRNTADLGVYAQNSGTATSVITVTGTTLGDTTSVATVGSTNVTAGQAYLAGGAGTQVSASVYHDTATGYYQLQLTDNTKGNNYQMRIVKTDGSSVLTAGSADPTLRLRTAIDGSAQLTDYSLTDQQAEWSVAQNASGVTSWDGKDILTQSGAQLALAQLDTAITAKDNARANLGALQNRLQNTITNLQIQAENLQAAESRISDVDVATEMTQFTRNNIMAQAGVAMLAQANSLPQLALQLLSGR